MPSFEYVALDHHGKTQHGFLDADSLRQARQVLRDKNLLPSKVSAIKGKTDKHFSWRTTSVSATELSLFTQQFAVLIQSGLAIEDAFQATSEQCDNKQLKSALQGVKGKVREGQTIAESMADYERVFPAVYRELIGAGEKSGELTQVLLQLADYTERAQRLRSNVLQAALYPITLTVVAFVIITVLMTYVVPKVIEQFQHVGQELPLVTQIMIMISDYVVEKGVITAIALIGFIACFRLLYRKNEVKLWLHEKFLRLPMLGKLIINIESARLLNTLSIMLNSGVPLLDALTTGQQTTGNLHFRNQLKIISEKVREGGSLNQAMTKAGLFPPITLFMITNGEMSGELSFTLNKAAEQQESQLNRVIMITTRLMEPLLIIVFGLIVLAIVLAILLPIMQLNDFTQL